jgi:hypothetical protein
MLLHSRAMGYGHHSIYGVISPDVKSKELHTDTTQPVTAASAAQPRRLARAWEWHWQP